MFEQSKVFKAVRQALYDSFTLRADALFNLLDSLSGRQTSHSVVELSNEQLFDRCYSSLYDAVDCYFSASDENKAIQERRDKTLEQVKMILPALPRPAARQFWLFGIDATPALRPWADTLSDRGVTYYPNPAPGNKPIGVGHSYSLLAILPERPFHAPPWVIPLSFERIPTAQTAHEVAAAQITALLACPDLPFGRDLTVNVVDSGYSKARYLYPVCGFPNHVELVRVAKNRKFFRIAPENESHPGHGGRPKCFGEVFDLKDEATWGRPDEICTIRWETHSGRILQVNLQRWNGLLMRGKEDAPMQKRPFDLVCCRVYDQAGKLVFKNALWLIVMGQRRCEISTVAAYGAYRQRYDLEHFFRFGKNKLLLVASQTPELEHEENWWDLVRLSYLQLWLAAPLSAAWPKPWERYLPEWKDASESQEPRLPSPSQVQRDYGRIIREFGTPAREPKPRGNSPGRLKGSSLGIRPRQPVVFKSRSPPGMTAQA